MKDLLLKIKRMRLGRNILWFFAMLLLGVLMFYILVFVLGPFSSFSRFPTAILLMYIGILSLVFMDKVHFSHIDTTKAITTNNTAYGLIILGYAIIIASVISTV